MSNIPKFTVLMVHEFADLVCKGIGYHHAGMDLQDRKNIEEAFASGNLPVLGMKTVFVVVSILFH